MPLSNPYLPVQMGFRKIAAALPAVLGRTLAGAFLAEYSRERFRVILVFADGTNYELHGTGSVSGSRGIEAGGIDVVRMHLMDDAALRVIEISPETLSRTARDR